MRIESITHKALRRYFEEGNARGLDAQAAERIGRMFLFLQSAESADDLLDPPNYGAHQLKGARAGVWSLTVTRNWRLTFRIDEAGAIVGLDLEDYH